MLKFNQKISEELAPYSTINLMLNFDQRNKSRLKITLDNGQEAGIVLENGDSLQHNDVLLSNPKRAEEAFVIRIKAALETVSTVYCDDKLQLARACYHLGNRHVSVQINADFIRYQHDHVLDEMVKGLGLNVDVEEAPFEPEAGAYHTASHGHRKGHSH
ncbi:MAG: urease accessory protein UreE [Cocleimonas sp.]|nr:urease accessory protein UreE [Cocleimonas sp.]